MEQQFQLKYYAKLDLFEQKHMSAEDRGWWLKRVEKELREKAEREKQAAQSSKSPSRPHR
jgi:uncharacterized protein YdaU (DUF1376 family)